MYLAIKLRYLFCFEMNIFRAPKNPVEENSNSPMNWWCDAWQNGESRISIFDLRLQVAHIVDGNYFIFIRYLDNLVADFVIHMMKALIH